MCERMRVGCAFFSSFFARFVCLLFPDNLGYFMDSSAGDDRIWSFVLDKSKRGVGPVCEDIHLG